MRHRVPIEIQKARKNEKERLRYKNNRVKILEKAKEYQARNRVRIRAYMKAWYSKNKRRQLRKIVVWQKNNRPNVRAIAAKRHRKQRERLSDYYIRRYLREYYKIPNPTPEQIAHRRNAISLKRGIKQLRLMNAAAGICKTN